MDNLARNAVVSSEAEPLILVDEDDNEIGFESKGACHDGHGMLHRAFQPSVGREVLVEVIDPSRSSGADFVRNFEADAQRLALLDHQNLASVIDYFRRPDGAFVVYSFPRGGTMADASAVDTTATFSMPGIYVLRLTADDSELSDSDTATVVARTAPPGRADGEWSL